MEAIRAYLERIKDLPILTKQEEVELVEKARKGIVKARWRIINCNLKLVVNIAKHYSRFNLPLMDLIAEGNIGLMRAIDKFNPKKGYRFSTYAAWWIWQAITRALIDQGKTIRIPVYMSEFIAKYMKTRNKLRQKYHRDPTRHEIAKKLRMPIAKVADIELWIEKKASLEAPVGDDGESQLADFIKADGYMDTEKDIEDFFRHERVLELLDSVKDRERRVLDLRFGISDGKPHTLAEVAQELKISRERVRQIEEVALGRLRIYAKELQAKELEI